MLSLCEVLDVLDTSFPERFSEKEQENQAVREGLSFNKVRIDSREVGANDLFVCLPGDRTHGHTFLSEAHSRGAQIALIEEVYKLSEKDPKELLYLRVPDTLAALQLLAKYVVDKEQPEIIAITGAMGKTTTRNFLFHLLEGAGLKSRVEPKELAATSDTLEEVSLQSIAEKLEPASEKVYNPALDTGAELQESLTQQSASPLVAQPSRNLNSQAGLPMAILNDLSGAKRWVIEMAMTHPGDIKSLVHIAPPTYSILTTMPERIEDYIHAAEFEVIEEAVRAKCEIFESEKLVRAYLPDDLPNLDGELSAIYAEKTVFSMTDPLAAYGCTLNPENRQIEVYERGEPKLTAPLYFPKHHLRNYFISLFVAKELGATWEELDRMKMDFKLPKMRFEKIEKGGVAIYSDAYNGSPIAMRTAIDAIEKPKGRLFAILGEVLGLGQHALKGHIGVIEYALGALDKAFFYGKMWNEAASQCEKEVSISLDHESLIAAVLKELKAGDVLYVKGSRLCNLDLVVEEIVRRL